MASKYFFAIFCYLIFINFVDAQKSYEFISGNDIISVPRYDFWQESVKPTYEIQSIRIDNNIITHIKHSNAKIIQLALPVGNGIHEATLQEAQLYTDNAKITTSSGNSWPTPEVKVYYGSIRNIAKSRVVLTIQENEWSILFSDNTGNYEVYSDNEEVGFIRRIPNIEQKRDIELEKCMDEEAINYKKTKQNARNAEANCLEVYVETDYAVYQSWMENTSRVVSWVNVIMANVIALYADEYIPIVLSGIYVWDQPDPYEQYSSLLSIKNEFVNYRQNNYTGRVAHLFSTRSIGGGVTHGIRGFCNSYPSYPGPFAFSSSLEKEFDGYPIYSYNVMNVSHEIGHLLGLRHTHACIWNGNQTQIDDCGNVWAADNNYTPEGSNCFDADNPILPSGSVGGTIMSFCHLVSGVGINLANGFGDQAGDLLRENFYNAPCITGTNCANTAPVNNSCINPIRLTVNNTCQVRTFTNEYATASGETPGFSCGNQGAGHDVWFLVEIPSSGNVVIETRQVPNGLTDMVLQTYTGECGNLTALVCDDNSGDGNHARIQLTGRTPGEQILVRVIENGSDQSGLYGICANDIDQPCHPDFNGLIQFYQETNGNNWTIKTGWQDGADGNDCDVCQWFGVVCNSAGRVTGLNLPNNNLSGAIGSSVLNIPWLDRLNLYNNNFSGNLPISPTQVNLLNYLDLGGNDFSGSIPAQYGNFSNIRSLYLDNNQLSGTLPVFLSLLPVTTLWLNHNDFSGCIPPEYQIFCQNEVNVRLQGNTLLPFGGNYAAFCANGDGGDQDGDGYCKGSEDCDDFDTTVYNGAPEQCDDKDNDCNGKIDDGAPEFNNTWVAATSGNWNDSSNWSLASMPYRCHHVFISPSSTLDVLIDDSESAYAASLTIGANGSLMINALGQLTIEERLGVNNGGNIQVFGQLKIENSISSLNAGFLNSGVLNIANGGRVQILNSGIIGFQNTQSGSILNGGILQVSGNHPDTGSDGLINLGTINNSGEINISGITGLECRLGTTAEWTNTNGSTFSIE